MLSVSIALLDCFEPKNKTNERMKTEKNTFFYPSDQMEEIVRNVVINNILSMIQENMGVRVMMKYLTVTIIKSITYEND